MIHGNNMRICQTVFFKIGQYSATYRVASTNGIHNRVVNRFNMG